MRTRGARSSQRGFSLIVVFILILVMVGVAATLMLTTQGDLNVAGNDRESASAFYAAEAGVAYAKDWLVTGNNAGSGNAAWSALLASGAQQLCTVGNGQKPGTTPKLAQVQVVYDAARPTSYQYCFHNNIDDPNYYNNPPTGDTVDGDGVLTIESYGFGPDGTVAHVAANIAVTAGGPSVNCYAGSGGGGCNSLKTGSNAQAGSIGNLNAVQTIGSGG